MEIHLNNYNEMLRYEKDMDILRTLVLWEAAPRDYVLEIIKMYSGKFASDIKEQGKILPGTLNLFHNALNTLNLILGITGEDIAAASEKQRYTNSGFWEMRRVIGQFRDVAEEVSKDGITHIITAGISGCVIGEYLGLFVNGFGREVPVDHMIFSRDGINPTKGHLRSDFLITGKKILIVDDAVMEAVTLEVMMREIKKICPGVELSLLTVDIDSDIKESAIVGRLKKLYLFEE
jgi:hypoxanthine-guanine phosphoribosyltransferase